MRTIHWGLRGSSEEYVYRILPDIDKAKCKLIHDQLAAGYCMWFAKCDNDATTVEVHTQLGDVPICGTCKEGINK